MVKKTEVGERPNILNREGRKKFDAEAEQKVIGIDGRERSRAQEDQLNEAFGIAFQGEVGRLVLDYIKSISINYVHGPEASNGVIRHTEGQRFMASMILERTRIGQKG